MGDGEMRADQRRVDESRGHRGDKGADGGLALSSRGGTGGLQPAGTARRGKRGTHAAGSAAAAPTWSAVQRARGAGGPVADGRGRIDPSGPQGLAGRRLAGPLAEQTGSRLQRTGLKDRARRRKAARRADACGKAREGAGGCSGIPGLREMPQGRKAGAGGQAKGSDGESGLFNGSMRRDASGEGRLR